MPAIYLKLIAEMKTIASSRFTLFFLWSPEVVLFTAVARSGELLAIMKPGMLSKMGKYKGRCQIGCLARIFKSQAVILLLAMYLISSGPILAFF